MGKKIILPLLHNISIGQLEEKYPEVADIQAISTADYCIDEIVFLFAEQLIKRLKEEREWRKQINEQHTFRKRISAVYHR